MKKINFALGILFFLGLTQTTIGQQNQASKDVVEDRFAYSCGVLAGANFKEIGLSKDLIALDEIWKGVEAFMLGDATITEKVAQQMANAKTIDLQGVLDKSKLSKASLTDFYYNYGIVIGANWKTFKIDFKTIVKADFDKGLWSILSNTALFTAETAQKEVSLKFKSIKKMEAEEQERQNEIFLKKNQTKASIITLESGVQYEVIKEGKGKKISKHSSESITIHYHGTLTNGKIFDSSVDKGTALTCTLAGVIKGWQEVLPLMKEGEKIRAYLPSSLGYGNQKRGMIPANSILIFEIELIQIGA